MHCSYPYHCLYEDLDRVSSDLRCPACCGEGTSEKKEIGILLVWTLLIGGVALLVHFALGK